MPPASRYVSCSLHNGRFYLVQLGSPGAAVASYWTPEVVAQEMDEHLDRVIDTLAQLDAVQAESVARPVPFRMVFVADELEDELRRRSMAG